MKTDWSLLEAWAHSKSDEAFGELVRRHSGFVFASALRQLRDPALADEVTQGVFRLLAQKAGTFREGIILPNWLFRSTRFIASKTQRTVIRRQKNETEAATMIYSETNSEGEENWRQIAPHLDEALAALPDKDREAMLLRFFQDKPLREVGEALGTSEEAAKKRVSRALEKMRFWLNKRKVPITTSGLALALTGRYAEAAPGSVMAKAKAAATSSVGSKAPFALTENNWSPWAKLAIGAASLVVIFSVLSFLPRSPVQVPSLEARNKKETVVTSVAPGKAASLQQIIEPHLRITFREKENGNLIPEARLVVEGNEMYVDEGVVEVSFSEPLEPVVHLRVNAPDRVPVTLSWNRHELANGPIEYSCLLERGGKIRGTIQNEAGFPVSDVKLVALFVTGSTRENIGRLEFKSDAGGRFESNQMPIPNGELHDYTIWITHPEYLRNQIEITSSRQFETNHSIVLKSGIVVRGTVVDENNIPIAGATVEATDAGTWPGFSALTEPNGAFTLGAFDEGQTVVVNFSAEGFHPTYHHVALKKDGPAGVYQILPMAPSPQEAAATQIRVHGTALDAKSGQPIERFKVHMFFNESRTLNFLLGEGSNGAFDWTLDRRNQEGYVLGFEAPGYWPSWSEFRKIHPGDEQFDITLQPGVIAQQILTPNGESAVGADVQLNAGGLTWDSSGALSLKGIRQARAKTDSEGRFVLQPTVEMRGVVATHESGYAMIASKELNGEPIHLQQWSSIEGEFLINGKPAPGRTVVLSDEIGQVATLFGTISVTTSDSGRFRFARIPNGTFRVSDGTLSPYIHPVKVNILPGQTAYVRLLSTRD